MAEMDTYHAQKSGDFADLAKDHIDGEIELYEQVPIYICYRLGID
jgi:sorting nexin-9/18/33